MFPSSRISILTQLDIRTFAVARPRRGFHAQQTSVMPRIQRKQHKGENEKEGMAYMHSGLP